MPGSATPIATGRSSVALRRLGTVEDCAKVVEFLVTDLSDYVTGVVSRSTAVAGHDYARQLTVSAAMTRRYAMSLSLDGVRVLELARYQAGPRGGMILSDLGAEVIKIERLGGEETRKHAPIVRGQSIYFTVYNRGKKSICLDMRTPRGKEIFADLVKTADIVLENFRPGTMTAMGFDYEQLKALNPGIILVSVSGFGQYGPYTDRPAFDPLGQAMSGLMSLTGKPVGQPLGTASSVVDRYTALHATIGTLAALRHRDRTGEGQMVDVCLLDSALTMVEIPTSYYLATGEEGGEGGRPPYRAKDG